MKTIEPGDLRQYSDVLLTRGGEIVTLRFVEVTDAAALQTYFRNLSVRSRYNRLMGAASELPVGQLEKFIHVGDGGSFSVVATMKADGVDRIVGEARYALDEDTARFEFGLSIDDGLQRKGLGLALLSNLACRAAALGAETLFGDTLRSNDAMQALARKAGFSFVSTPGDWKQVRFEKRITIVPQDIQCASWRVRAELGAYAPLVH
ncbi:MAG: family acetyltransferase [Tardiphaga sp.]|uniref:GNAT family N-acetyltransferase n=1 Tax=Tardiphaga sp. TaxID=1926292 RepID=UPI00262292AD|nr:GNAT family N-acetyltransferase [Tardiphaga sp.]MDB5504405.1 family acetyltransferase [Tardiphaga sp.]